MDYEMTIPLLVAVAVVGLGGAGLIYRRLRRNPLQARLHGVGVLTGGPTSSAAGPSLSQAGLRSPSILGAMDRLGRAVSSDHISSPLRDKLAQAGFHGRSAATIYLGAKVVLFVLGLGLGWVALWPVNLSANQRLGIILGTACALFFLPNIDLYIAGQRRHLEVRRHLPDAIDLLEICVSAGMGLDQGWNSVTDEIRTVSPTLADEMALTDLEIHLGATRAVAMRHMAQRTGSTDLSSLVAVLVQSERFGTSVAAALRTFATSMREQRSSRAQECAEKMAVKLIFPMVLFVFPAVVVVMAGPAVLAMAKALAQ